LSNSKRVLLLYRSGIVVRYVNERKRVGENQQIIIDIQHSIEGCGVCTTHYIDDTVSLGAVDRLTTIHACGLSVGSV
jgi:hypothetical protein